MINKDIFREYREAKANADMWKKEAENLGKQLKERLIDTPILEQDGFKYERRVAVKQKVDEESLMEWLAENNYKEALKSKLVIDDDKLAELLVEGKISTDIMDKFITNTEVISLYCKEIKQSKKGVE